MSTALDGVGRAPLRGNDGQALAMSGVLRRLSPAMVAVASIVEAAHAEAPSVAPAQSVVERGGFLLLAITGVLVLLGLAIYIIAKRMK